VGKTSVALAVARQVLPDLYHGAWLVDLSTLTMSRAVPQAVARATGVRESYAATIDEALIAFLRDRELLLVMDNCEHVVDACAALLDELLDQAPRLRVPATSREPLRIRGEVARALPLLVVPMQAPHRDLGRLSEIASVQLFLDRAHGVRPGLELTNRNADTIVEICRRLDGIPLALELAATRVGGLSLEHIAERLRDSFAVLISGGRSRAARHQTLRATLEWSHELLSPVEQTVFGRLGAFAGGWTMPAAEAVCAGGGVDPAEVADIVAGLVDKSLVVLDEEDGRALPISGACVSTPRASSLPARSQKRAAADTARITSRSPSRPNRKCIAPSKPHGCDVSTAISTICVWRCGPAEHGPMPKASSV
jgi:non-specific serine/threonine protein kinase